MRRIAFLFVACLVIILAVLFSLPRRSKAITYGFVDSNNTFSNVGAFIVKSPTGKIYPICSGTMITANVFLTASHCTAAYTQELAPLGYSVWVSLDQSIPFGDLTANTTKLLAVSYVVTNPNYSQRQSDSGDIGVLILADSLKGVTPATLPTCGLLDQLDAQNGLKAARFTAVGYGVQNRVVGGGVPYFQARNPIPRMYALSGFNALNGGYLRLSENPSTGNGGTCSGDSGGPDFLTVDGQQILPAITITGDTVCRSTNVDYRTDTASAQAFFAYVNGAFGVSIPINC